MRSRRRSGFLQMVLACGCVLFLATVAVVAAGAWYFWGHKTPSQPAQTDSGQVKALSEQILPGLEPPSGHVGFLCQTSGSEQRAYLGPAGVGKDSTLQSSQLLFMMESFPAGSVTENQAETDLKDTLGQQGYALGKVGKVLEGPQEAMLHLGAGQARAQKRLIDGTPRVLQYSMLLENPQGRTVVLVVEGPQDSFNQAALDGALSKVQARPLGMPLSAAPATPAAPETVAAPSTPTPAESEPESPHTPTPTPKKPH